MKTLSITKRIILYQNFLCISTIHPDHPVYIFYCSPELKFELADTRFTSTFHASLGVYIQCLYANAYLSYRAREPKAAVITTLRR